MARVVSRVKNLSGVFLSLLWSFSHRSNEMLRRERENQPLSTQQNKNKNSTKHKITKTQNK
jgi:hypothetical protein